MPTSSKRVLAAILVTGILLLVMLFTIKDVYKRRQYHAFTSDERTLAIIKPDAVMAGNADNIITLIKENGFIIRAQEEKILDKETAEKFYAIHNKKPFFNELINYITSGPLIILVLGKANAVNAWRNLMGATNPSNAQEGTIRKLYGTDIQRNAVHGSDSVQNAQQEIKLFFPLL